MARERVGCYRGVVVHWRGRTLESFLLVLFGGVQREGDSSRHQLEIGIVEITKQRQRFFIMINGSNTILVNLSLRRIKGGEGCSEWRKALEGEVSMRSEV